MKVGARVESVAAAFCVEPNATYAKVVSDPTLTVSPKLGSHGTDNMENVESLRVKLRQSDLAAQSACRDACCNPSMDNALFPSADMEGGLGEAAAAECYDGWLEGWKPDGSSLCGDEQSEAIKETNSIRALAVPVKDIFKDHSHYSRNSVCMHSMKVVIAFNEFDHSGHARTEVYPHHVNGSSDTFTKLGNDAIFSYISQWK